jgi:deoxycytidine triphosphate deaminase
MNLTGKQILEQGIIFGIVEKDNIQQHSVDLNIIKIEKVIGPGFVPKSGKTKLAERVIIMPTDRLDPRDYSSPIIAWRLEPGVYDVTLAQGCKIPPNWRMKLVHRSSLFRNGSENNSSLFDAGFETNNIGTVVYVSEPILIEVGARITTAYVDASNEVNNLYNGQWQGDQQREFINIDTSKNSRA